MNKYKDFTSTKYGDLTGQTYNGNIYVFNENLTSLKGSPKIVTGNFYCSYNNLTSLKYCPEIVKGRFNCTYNKLTSLKYLPYVDLGKLYSDFTDKETMQELKSSRPELLL